MEMEQIVFKMYVIINQKPWGIRDKKLRKWKKKTLVDTNLDTDKDNFKITFTFT